MNATTFGTSSKALTTHKAVTTLFMAAICAAALAVTMALSGCGATTSKYVGTWVAQDATYTKTNMWTGAATTETENPGMTLKLEADGTATWETPNSGNISGTWKEDGNSVTFTFSELGTNMSYTDTLSSDGTTVSGNNFGTKYDDLSFVKQ